MTSLASDRDRWVLCLTKNLLYVNGPVVSRYLLIMDLLFDDHIVGEEIVLTQLMNCSFFVHNGSSKSWSNQTPGEFCRILLYQHRSRLVLRQTPSS